MPEPEPEPEKRSGPAQRARETLHLATEPWPIAKPKPYPNNPRKITDAAVDKVAESIQRYGWRAPIVVDNAGVVLAGHTRLLAAKKLGLTHVPVHVATGLYPDEANAFRLADNRTGDEAEWDMGKLAIELGALPSDLPTGFDDDEKDALFGEETDALMPVDTRPPPKMAWCLIGIPLVRYAEVASIVDQLAAIDGATVKTATTDYGSTDDA